ncbi:MAG: hypothetical protein JXA71_19585, partial [Chitinispirillaceae bacterium]|nr:hypothetical protein [Chitinispirillaceae bacterium]
MNSMRKAVFTLVSCMAAVTAQQNSQMSDMGLNLYLPSFEAQLSIGFNYDLLKSPLDVSFEQPRGFFGFNVPVEQTLDMRSLTTYMDPAVDEMFSDTLLIKNGDDFKPRAGARQNPNITVSVDMPMLGGVASFSNIQNFYMNYQTMLGNPNLFLNPDTDSLGVNFLLRGTINVPLTLSMSWETMTFSYAFEFNKWLMAALSLHRHVFSVDLRGKVDADLLGRYTIEAAQGGTVDMTIEGELDYPSDRIHGLVYGYFDAEVWSPSLAFKIWRFSLVSRFGLTTRARGQLLASYSLPFFIDPETFQNKIDFNDPSLFNDPDFRIGLQTNAVDSVTYTTARVVGGKTQQSDLEWRMPTGLTMNFDVIRDHFSVTYSKLFGDIGMKLDRIVKVRNTTSGDTTVPVETDSITLDLGFKVDHIMLTRLALYHAHLTLGIFG